MDYGQALQDFLIKEEPEINFNELSELLHTISEKIGWPDEIDSVSQEQAIMCWHVIETLREKELPEELIL